MIPDYHISFEGWKIRSDTKEFLNRTLLNLFRLLGNHNLSSKDCHFLGTNDLYILRGVTNVTIIFSRATLAFDVTVAEIEVPMTQRVLPTGECKVEEVDQEAQLKEPVRIDDIEEVVLGNLVASETIDPVIVKFPLSYLTLEGEDSDEASKSVAELLIEPTKEDIDRKNRIQRVLPIFSGRDFLVDPQLVFVLMPFSEPYTGIYDNLIKPTVESEDFACEKSNEIFTATSIVMEEIWQRINTAALVIAEISDTNPNVMYELDICHTIGKEVMMITQTEPVPFNFRHLRHYLYEDSVSGSEKLRIDIKSILQHIRSTRW